MILPPLPPLPLVDDHLFVDNALLESWTLCGRKTEYSVFRNRVLANAKAALNYGGAIHEALKTRYTTSPDLATPEVYSHQSEVLTAWFYAKPNPVDDRRSLDLALRTIQAYNEIYQCESFSVLSLDGKPCVEMPFVFHLFSTTVNGKPINVMYCGKIDLVVRQEGAHWVVDHKTTSIFGEQTFKGYVLSPQMFGYCAGWLKTTGELPNGFVVNCIKVPQIQKTTGIAHIEGTTQFFGRVTQAISLPQLKEWEYNTITLIKEVLWHYENGFMPQKKSWCYGKFGPCDFVNVCEMEDPILRVDYLMGSNEYVNNEWSPLNDFKRLALPERKEDQ